MDYKKTFSGYTLKQFEAVAEDWYQRTNRLREASEKAEDSSRRMRYMNLFFEMMERMKVVGMIYHHAHMPKRPDDFESAGVSFG